MLQNTSFSGCVLQRNFRASGRLAHFHFGKLAHFREEIPAGPAARIVPVHLAHLAAVIRIFRLN